MKNKKQIFQVAMVAAMVVFLSSCYTTHHVTNNSVGTKQASASAIAGLPGQDYSYSTVCKKGKIQKIGTTKHTYTFGGAWAKTTVTGE